MWYYVAKYIKSNNCEEFGILQSLQANKLADHRFTVHSCEHGVLHGKNHFAHLIKVIDLDYLVGSTLVI